VPLTLLYVVKYTSLNRFCFRLILSRSLLIVAWYSLAFCRRILLRINARIFIRIISIVTLLYYFNIITNLNIFASTARVVSIFLPTLALILFVIRYIVTAGLNISLLYIKISHVEFRYISLYYDTTSCLAIRTGAITTSYSAIYVSLYYDTTSYLAIRISTIIGSTISPATSLY